MRQKEVGGFLKLPVLLAVLGLIFVLFLGFSIFGPNQITLESEVFYKDNFLELRAQRVKGNYFLHYNGISANYECMPKKLSSNIIDDSFFSYKRDEWHGLNRASGTLGSGHEPDMDEILEAGKSNYIVADEGVLAFVGGWAMNFSWDSCSIFRDWSPDDNLPIDLIRRDKEKECLLRYKDDPGYAEGWAEVNCPSHNFIGENTVTYNLLEATKEGAASFTVSSKAFLESPKYIVETEDFGETWQMEPF